MKYSRLPADDQQLYLVVEPLIDYPSHRSERPQTTLERSVRDEQQVRVME